MSYWTKHIITRASEFEKVEFWTGEKIAFFMRFHFNKKENQWQLIDEIAMTHTELRLLGVIINKMFQ